MPTPPQFPISADRSEQLSIDSAGRLLAHRPLCGAYHAVFGAKDSGPNTPFDLACDERPTLPGLARRSRRADRWLVALLLVLGLAALYCCAPATPAPAPTVPQEARDYRAEHARPAHGRYDWYEVDTTNE